MLITRLQPEREDLCLTDLPKLAKQGETSTHWHSMQHKLCYTASASKKIAACWLTEKPGVRAPSLLFEDQSGVLGLPSEPGPEYLKTSFGYSSEYPEALKGICEHKFDF